MSGNYEVNDNFVIWMEYVSYKVKRYLTLKDENPRQTVLPSFFFFYCFCWISIVFFQSSDKESSTVTQGVLVFINIP